jgi:hypothetical protein
VGLGTSQFQKSILLVNIFISVVMVICLSLRFAVSHYVSYFLYSKGLKKSSLYFLHNTIGSIEICKTFFVFENGGDVMLQVRLKESEKNNQ